MKKLFTIFLVALALVPMMSKAQTQRALIECVTGAWCPWCPSGSAYIEFLENKYPDKVYGVKIHNNDGMAIAEEKTFSGFWFAVNQNFGYSAGYPMGTVNRIAFSTGQNKFMPMLSPSSWDQVIPQILAAKPSVDVNCFYTLNSSTRELQITVTADFVTDYAAAQNGQINFNAYIVEDEVMGSGSQYDQKNNYSNNASYKDDPVMKTYYSQPATITNYKHMAVCRKMLGDVWGTTGIIPSSCTKGNSFKTTYNYTVPSNYNINKVRVIGLVQEMHTQYFDVRKVLNSAEGKMGAPNSELTSTGPATKALSKGSVFTKDYNVKNTTTGTITFKFDITTSPRTPSDWTATVAKTTGLADNKGGNGNKTQAFEMDIAPGATEKITLSCTATSTGIGDFALAVYDKYDPNGFKSRDALILITNDIDKCEIINDKNNGANSVVPILNAKNLTGYVTINPSDYTTFSSDLTNLKTVIWTTGISGQFTNSDAQSLQTIINKGTGVVINGAMANLTLSTASPSILNMMGLQYIKECFQGVSDGNVTLIGYNNDPISAGFNQACKLSTYLTEAIKITDPTKAFPLLRHKNVDSVVAARATVGSSRVVLLGVYPSIITNTSIRDEFFAKCVKWVTHVMPEIEIANANIQFTNTEIGNASEKTITIKNNGVDPLNITDMSVDYDKAMIFSIKDGITTLSVDGGQSKDITIVFTPKTKTKVDATLTITSNSTVNTPTTVALSGTGLASGVEEENAVSGYSMNIAPNPAKDESEIILNNSKPEALFNIYMIDASGRKVQTISNSGLSTGINKIKLNVNGLSQGNYFVIVETSTGLRQFPLAIVR